MERVTIACLLLLLEQRSFVSKIEQRMCQSSSIDAIYSMTSSSSSATAVIGWALPAREVRLRPRELPRGTDRLPLRDGGRELERDVGLLEPARDGGFEEVAAVSAASKVSVVGRSLSMVGMAASGSGVPFGRRGGVARPPFGSSELAPLALKPSAAPVVISSLSSSNPSMSFCVMKSHSSCETLDTLRRAAVNSCILARAPPV